MPEAIIKVGKKDKPGPNKVRWKIVGFNNEVFQVDPEFVPLFVEGRTYKVFYEDREFRPPGGEVRKFRVIVRRPEDVPDVSTGAPQLEAPTYSRPRAAKEDEEGVNRRHRLNWIGERLDKLCPSGLPITYESLRPLVGVLEDLYDTVSEGPAPPQEDPRQKDYPAGYKTPAAPKANAYTGRVAPVDPDMDDDIPFN